MRSLELKKTPRCQLRWWNNVKKDTMRCSRSPPARDHLQIGSILGSNTSGICPVLVRKFNLCGKMWPDILPHLGNGTQSCRAAMVIAARLARLYGFFKSFFSSFSLEVYGNSLLTKLIRYWRLQRSAGIFAPLLTTPRKCVEHDLIGTVWESASIICSVRDGEDFDL